MRALEHGARTYDLDPRIGEVLLIDARDARDLFLFGRDERRPIEGNIVGAPTESSRVLKLIVKAAGVDIKFFRHAAANDAGAADAKLLGDRDFGAIAGRDARSPHAAGTRADHQEIVIEFGHFRRRADLTVRDPSCAFPHGRGSSCRRIFSATMPAGRRTCRSSESVAIRHICDPTRS